MSSLARDHPVVHQVSLVDGDAGIRKGLQRFLETHHLLVRVFATARELLDAPAAPGVIVADASLPDMDVDELLDELHRRGNDQPVIVLASHRDAALAERALRRGAVDRIEKPFVDAVLIARIQAALAPGER
jgi:two-component system response regulator FixJ